MQIDFHHATTYVLARTAGFSKEQATVVAHCSQYIDDATNGGTIRFDNGATYTRICSAHKMLDYSNSDNLKNSHVWLPFHFLPGNGGVAAGENPSEYFIDKLVCVPNSPIAQDMVRATIQEKGKPYGLHRLGVAMHVYADTWAHQGFAGVDNPVNEAHDIHRENVRDSSFMDRVKNFLVSTIAPLGHGAVLSYPDRPYLKWSYTNGYDKPIERDNPRDFLLAAEHVYSAMVNFLEGDTVLTKHELPERCREKLKFLFENLVEENGEVRHQIWLDKIENGYFDFGAEKIDYIAKGEGSWKHKAIGTKEHTDTGKEVFEYHEGFLSSDWKMFHDAVQVHRMEVIHEILPKYGICVG